jgi:hypothetical protein
MAMKSSIDADRAQPGYNYSSSRVDRWAEAINRTDGNTPWVQGGGFEGVFTIPVCYDPSGTSITSVRSNGGRHYPCSCLDGNGGDQTVLFAVSHSLKNIWISDLRLTLSASLLVCYGIVQYRVY